MPTETPPREAESATSGKLTPQYVNWELLPPGNKYGIYTTDCPAIKEYLSYMRNKHPKDYDQNRIDRVLTLNPDEWFVGKLQDDGYSVFVFKNRNAAILECPIYGNALYLVWGDWKQLSELTKEQLRNYVTDAKSPSRYIHRDDSEWFPSLCRELRIQSARQNNAY